MQAKHPIDGLRAEVPTRDPDPVLLEQLTQLSAASARPERRAYPKVLAAAASVAALAATTWLAGAVPGTTSPLAPSHHHQEPSRTAPPSPTPSTRAAHPTTGATPGSGALLGHTPTPHPARSTAPAEPQPSTSGTPAQPTPSDSPHASRSAHPTPPGLTASHGKHLAKGAGNGKGGGTGTGTGNGKGTGTGTGNSSGNSSGTGTNSGKSQAKPHPHPTPSGKPGTSGQPGSQSRGHAAT